MDMSLGFLKEVSSEELEVFVDVMLDKGKLTEKITKSDEYKKYGRNYKNYIERITDEYLDFGTNTISNFFSGRKTYKEVLCDIAKDMKVKFDKTSNVEVIENLLLEKLLVNIWDKLSKDDKMKMIGEFAPDKHIISSQELKEATWLIDALKRNHLTAYKIILFLQDQITFSTLGRNLKEVGKFIVLRFIGGPISWVFAVFSIAGPAYRVVVPCTILIATMRRRLAIKKKLDIKD